VQSRLPDWAAGGYFGATYQHNPRSLGLATTAKGRAMIDWQPITDAQKDGKYRLMGQNEIDADWLRWRNGRWEFCDGSFLSAGFEPTVYCATPLPTPPKQG
jgi:hypothetical protein